MFETSPPPTYELYNSMKWILAIQPDLDHYTCTVDLLVQYGKLKEALAIIVKLAILIFPDVGFQVLFLQLAKFMGP